MLCTLNIMEYKFDSENFVLNVFWMIFALLIYDLNVTIYFKLFIGLAECTELHMYIRI